MNARNSAVDPDKDLVGFPLFHGTSSHYLAAFKPGKAPALWPHKEVALRLLTDAWDVLSVRRHEVPVSVRENLFWNVTYDEMPWMVRNVIEQASRHSNWQHGDLYVTPSKLTAVNYACGGARHGGELLTFCKRAIEALVILDPKAADELMQGAESLGSLLRGTEHPPILVEFDSIRVDDLSTEATNEDVRSELASLQHMEEVLGSRERALETLGQQTNFRLASGCGIVKRIFEVHVEDADQHQPLDPFNLMEIPRPNLTE